MAFQLSELQNEIRAAKLDGWLFYDFRGRDPIAQRILKLPAGMRTRRWFYFVPAKGTPKKLVHKIETESLAARSAFRSAACSERFFDAAESVSGCQHCCPLMRR